MIDDNIDDASTEITKKIKAIETMFFDAEGNYLLPNNKMWHKNCVFNAKQIKIRGYGI